MGRAAAGGAGTAHRPNQSYDGKSALRGLQHQRWQVRGDGGHRAAGSIADRHLQDDRYQGPDHPARRVNHGSVGEIRHLRQRHKRDGAVRAHRGGGQQWPQGAHDPGYGSNQGKHRQDERAGARRDALGHRQGSRHDAPAEKPRSDIRGRRPDALAGPGEAGAAGGTGRHASSRATVVWRIRRSHGYRVQTPRSRRQHENRRLLRRRKGRSRRQCAAIARADRNLRRPSDADRSRSGSPFGWRPSRPGRHQDQAHRRQGAHPDDARRHRSGDR